MRVKMWSKISINMLTAIVFIIACSESCAELLNRGYPECANLTFNSVGQLDLGTMLYDCSSNIPGALTNPAMYPVDGNQYYPLNITIQVVVNNFISVDDVVSQINLDIYFRNRWNDPRIFLPNEMYNYLSPEALIDGLDITEYITNQQNPLNFWFPDLIILEAVDMNVLTQDLKYFPNGTLFWSRHIMLTLSEETMNLRAYPLDSQNFTMTIQSYAYTNQLETIELMSSPLGFNFDWQYQEYYINLNQLWTFDSYSAYVVPVKSPIVYNQNRQKSTAYINLKFTRQSFGIVYRLGLPVAIFLVLVGFSFWADIDKRIDVTMQMLLVVAALYLIIGQVIPFVGYYTRMDMYITVAFLILTMTTGVHFATLVLDAKVDKYPANAFLRDCLVFFFRTIWVPAALMVFIVFFDVTTVPIMLTLAISTLLACCNGYLKRKVLYQSFKVSILNLRAKEIKINAMNNKFKEDVGKTQDGFVRKVKQLTKFETFLLNNTRHKYKLAAKNAVDLEAEKQFDERPSENGTAVEMSTFGTAARPVESPLHSEANLRNRHMPREDIFFAKTKEVEEKPKYFRRASAGIRYNEYEDSDDEI